MEQITYEIDTKKVQTITKPSPAPQPLPLAVQMVEKGKKRHYGSISLNAGCAMLLRNFFQRCYILGQKNSYLFS